MHKHYYSGFKTEDGYEISTELIEKSRKAIFETLKKELPEKALRVDIIQYILEDAVGATKTLGIKL